MANPNIVSVSSIYGKTHQVALDTTVTTDILSCASNKLYKINYIVIENVDGSNSATVTMGIIKSGVSVILIAKTIAVPADATLVLVDKNWGLYLEEADAIQCLASSTSDFTCTISYEILDDA